MFSLVFILVPFLWLWPVLAAENGNWTAVDGVVATIKDVPVLSSDVHLEADFGLLTSDGLDADFNSLLGSYLNRLLILKELEDIGGFRLAEGQAEDYYRSYLAGFDDMAVFEGKLERWGISEREIYKRLDRALLASLYTESRIKFLVKVLPSDIEEAYEKNPDRWGHAGVFEAWESVKAELMEESFRLEKGRWLDSLRQRYGLVVFQTVRDIEP
jgi:hypothetical protein